MPLVDAVFCGARLRVSPALAERLKAAHESLMAQWRASSNVPFAAWHGVRASGSAGWRRAPSGFHGSGDAIDLNYPTNGYSVVRTTDSRGRVVYGGERAGANLKGVREAFCGAVDRAMAARGLGPADLAARRPGESTADVWRRFKTASDAVAAYLAPYYGTSDAYDAGAADVLPGVEVPAIIAADYHALRVPLVVGAPSSSPRLTRNPAVGLFDLRLPVVEALCAQGLRWGMSDFGASESGDAMHFDIGRRSQGTITR